MSAPIVVFVTNPRFGLAHTMRVIASAARELGEGRLMVQLRDKEGGELALRSAGRELRRSTRDAGALLIVNGPVSVADDIGADGVHFPSRMGQPNDSSTAGHALAERVAEARARLGAETFVTTAAHDDVDVQNAIAAEVTGILVSPIFASPGKGAARGVSALASARASVDASRRGSQPDRTRGRNDVGRLLVYALGGVDAAVAAACAGAGAYGVAAIRALYDDATRSSLCAVASASFGS